MVPVPKDLTTKVLQKKYLGIESDIIKQQRVRNKNNDFSTEISYAKRTEKSPIARVPFISQSRRIRDYQDLSETIENQTLPSRLRTPIFTLQEEQVYLQPGQ